MIDNSDFQDFWSGSGGGVGMTRYCRNKIRYNVYVGHYMVYYVLLCYYPRRTAKVMFSPVLVCLSVWLLATLRKKRLKGFSWNCQCWWDLAQGTIWRFSRCSVWPLENRIFSSFLDFYETFSKGRTWDKEQSEQFRDVAFNSLIPGRFFIVFLFLGLVFVINIAKKTGNRFSWKFHEMIFHTCLDCLTVSNRDAA